MLDFLNQSNFPTLWKIFQLIVGGTINTRRLCKLKYKGQKRVLEVGCSVGNVSRAFVNIPQIQFTGIDIDPVVINYAKKDFKKYPNFKFICTSLEDFTKKDEKFEYILFAGVCHHVDTKTLKSMLHASSKLLENNGEIVVVDGLLPEPEDSRFIHLYRKLEKGQYVRKGSELFNILGKIPSLKQKEFEIHFSDATPFSWPKCARIGIFVLSKKYGCE